jgi:predicted dehydrogenase
MVLETLIVGFGNSGRRLHMPSVLEARAADRAGIFGALPPFAIDPAPVPEPSVAAGHLRSTLEETGDLDPALTVVHVCTPPTERIPILEILAGFGFRKFIVEKPLALSVDELEWLDGVVGTYDLEVGVAMPWLSSCVTRRLERALANPANGRLRRFESVQDKPRFARSLRKADHPSAFDVELPHALGILTHLLGAVPAVTAARCTDLAHDLGVVPHMGSAWIKTAPINGVSAEIQSNLASPIRQRFVRLRFERSIVTGFYSISGDDPYAQLTVESLRDREVIREVFVDNPFPRMIAEWYEYFAGVRARPTSGLALNAAVVRVLAEAKAQAGLSPHSASVRDAGEPIAA